MFWSCKLTSLQFGFRCFPSCCLQLSRFSSVLCCGGKFASSVWAFQGYEICKTGKEEDTDTDIDTITVTARKSSASTRVSHRYHFFWWENQCEYSPLFPYEPISSIQWVPFAKVVVSPFFHLARSIGNQSSRPSFFLTEQPWIDIGHIVYAAFA